jgi:hypothetical protein
MWEHILGQESQRQFLEAMLSMVKTGGAYTIVGITIYYVTPVLRVLGIAWLLYKGFIRTLDSISNLYLMRKYNKNMQVTLLSKQANKHLEDAITHWRKEHEVLSKELLNSVKDLREESKKKDPEMPA